MKDSHLIHRLNIFPYIGSYAHKQHCKLVSPIVYYLWQRTTKLTDAKVSLSLHFLPIRDGKYVCTTGGVGVCLRKTELKEEARYKHKRSLADN